MMFEKFFNRGRKEEEGPKIETIPDKLAGLLRSAEEFAKKVIIKAESAKPDPGEEKVFKGLKLMANRELISLQAEGQLGTADTKEKQKDLLHRIIKSLEATDRLSDSMDKTDEEEKEFKRLTGEIYDVTRKIIGLK